jgi:acyl-CoA synthetase (AMP-forming)/AMP-acid ligase II
MRPLPRLRAEAELLVGRGADLGLLTAILAARWGDRPALESTAPVPGLRHGPTWTYADLEEATARLAAAHRASGVLPGDTVLIAVGNTPATLLHVFALARLGALAAPINDRLRDGELAAVALATGATRAVVSADLSDSAALSHLRVTLDGPATRAG